MVEAVLMSLKQAAPHAIMVGSDGKGATSGCMGRAVWPIPAGMWRSA